MELIIMQPADLRKMITEVLTEILTANPSSGFNPPGQYLTRKETAALLKVSQATLWRWYQDDILVPVRIGSKVLYHASSIHKILNNKKPLK